jgi:hypothetical protein
VGPPFQLNSPRGRRPPSATSRRGSSGAGCDARTRRAHLPDNAGQTWTKEEEDTLIAEFKSGEPSPQIAARHGRTLRAIEAQLERLGLITADKRTTDSSFVR